MVLVLGFVCDVYKEILLRRRSAAAYIAGSLKNGRTRNPLTLWTTHVLACTCTGLGAHTG